MQTEERSLSIANAAEYFSRSLFRQRIVFNWLLYCIPILWPVLTNRWSETNDLGFLVRKYIGFVPVKGEKTGFSFWCFITIKQEEEGKK